RPRVRFDRELLTRFLRKRATDVAEAVGQFGRGEIRRCAAAEEERVDLLRTGQLGFEFAVQRLQVVPAPVVATDGDGEIAIAAGVRAEGKMHVRGARQDPGRFDGGHSFTCSERTGSSSNAATRSIVASR